MPAVSAVRADAVFVPADPPRRSWLALVPPAGDANGDSVPEVPPGVDPAATAVTTLDVVRPRGASGRSYRTVTVPVRRIPLAAALPWLVAFAPADDTPAALAAWVTATRLGVDLVARGRLHPAVTATGHDTWRAGPLDAADESRLAALLAAFPATAHNVVLPGVRPLSVPGPGSLVRACWDAVADALPRTAAAPRVAGHPAFAATAPTPVATLAPWLATATHGLGGGGARPVVRLDIPFDDDADPVVATFQLRSHTDPSLLIDAADLWDAPAAVLARLGEDAETDLLLALRRGAAVWPPLARALDDARPDHLELDEDEAADLVGPVADDLTAAGFEVLWPAGVMKASLALRAVVATPAPGSLAPTGLDLGAVLAYRWQASVGGEALNAEEVQALAEAKRAVVRLRGRWVTADPAMLARLRRGGGKLRVADALAAALTGTALVDGEPLPVDVPAPVADLAERLRAGAGASATALPEPAGLHATLRPYQRRGLAWLAGMVDTGLGGCLADDMGLGKTVQLIALHLHRRAVSTVMQPTLVVCPASLLGNWERELARFAPDVPVRRFHGSERHLEGVAPDEVVLCTYGVVRSDPGALAEIGWGVVVADEAQHVKNPLSRAARALRAVPAGARVALTGTPVENRLTELWAILDWTTPGLLGPLEAFRRNVAVPVERHREPQATERLATLVRPFLLRRRKIDPGIAPELPPKTESDVVVPLTTEQATLYEAVVREALADIAAAKGVARHGLVLKLLTALKQIANHPAQFLGQDGPLEGRSGKLEALDELLDVILDEGESTLVFTQFVAMGKLVRNHLVARGLDPLFLHGSVPVARRTDLVDRFQAGEAPVLILSLKAGGTGLNLTRATHVIHYDRWWNPAVEDQATDRAYRIGQDRPVQVHRLVTEGTVEDRVAALLARKRELADAVVGTGEAWIGDLDDRDLARLVTLTGEESSALEQDRARRRTLRGSRDRAPAGRGAGAAHVAGAADAVTARQARDEAG
jgi:superfamily II DNA or RNA helicase